MSAGPAETPQLPELEIAHVLFMDVVAFSKMPIDQQRAILRTLQAIVQSTGEFVGADSGKRLIRLPTGDGMALVFFGDPESPARCALQLRHELRDHPEIKLRIGINSGPVYRVADINANANVAGGGINLAQRVMDCGDSGHILVSQAVAEVLGQLSGWSGCLHDLGEVEVKHGVRVHLFNLYTANEGNPELPQKVSEAVAVENRKRAAEKRLQQNRKLRLASIVGSIIFLSFPLGWWMSYRNSRSAPPRVPPLAEGMSLAVLPFDIGAGDAEALKIAAEHTVDDLFRKLSPLTGLHTVSRSDVFGLGHKKPLEAAQELGANLVVTGAVQGTPNQMRVKVDLYNVATGRHKEWDQECSDASHNLFKVEDNIYHGLLTELDLKPSAEEQQRASSHPPQDLAAFDLYLRGEQAMRNPQDIDNVHAAIDWFEKATQKDSSYALAWAGLAGAYLQMYLETRNTLWATKALGTADYVRRLDDEHRAEVHVALGRIYDATGDRDNAIAELKHAAKLAPNSDDVYRRLGKVYDHAGKKEEAIQSYQTAVTKNPHYWANFDTLGKAFLMLGRYKEAEDSFKRVNELVDSSNPVGWEGLGNVYFYEGHVEQCIDYYEKAIAIKPYFATVSNLGYAYFSLKRYDDAVRMFRKAVEMNPEHEEAVGNLADAYRWAGQTDKANETYSKAISLAKNEMRVNHRDTATMGNLALYYAKSGDVTQGLKLIANARSIDSKDCQLIYDEAVVNTLAKHSKSAVQSLVVALQKHCPVESARNDPELREVWASPEIGHLSPEIAKN
jgi:tetratricopeptide (TPR) repeat protein/class 3 adenylate cyclase